MAESVYIAAGGESGRMQRQIEQLGLPAGYPKGLLPTTRGGNETFLGRLVRQAKEQDSHREVLIDTNPTAGAFIAVNPDIDKSAKIEPRQHDGTFFGSMLKILMKKGEQMLGYGSDIYTEAIEREMTAHHEKSPYPITFLVSPNVLRARQGFAYEVSASGQITSFSRLEEGDEKDLINIGGYLFDPEKEVVRTISELIGQNKLLPGRASGEVLVEALMNEGLIGAFVCDAAFNINLPQTYESFLDYQDSKEQSRQPSATVGAGAIALAANIVTP